MKTHTIFIYYIGYLTIKDSKYVKTNNVNHLYLIFGKVNGYFEEIDENKFLTLVPTNESKEIIKKYEELQSRIRDLIRSITENSDNFDKKYMKIKFNSDDDLPLSNGNHDNSIIAVRAIFYEKGNFIHKFS